MGFAHLNPPLQELVKIFQYTQSSVNIWNTLEYTTLNMMSMSVTSPSADLMPRNLIRRIEIMTPIVENSLKHKIKEILSLQLQDNRLRWKLKNTGEYKLVKAGDKVINNHEILEEYITKSIINLKRRLENISNGCLKKS